MIDINLNGSLLDGAGLRARDAAGLEIVNIGSVLGLDDRRGCRRPPTAASKAAIIGLTRDLAQQWTGRKGIRVNALAPGFFASEMTEQYPDGYIEQMLAAGARPAASRRS